jgi:hypothetical protein
MQTLLAEKSLKLLLNGKCCCKLASMLVIQAGKHCLDLATVVYGSETSNQIKSNQIYISPAAATKFE